MSTLAFSELLNGRDECLACGLSREVQRYNGAETVNEVCPACAPRGAKLPSGDWDALLGIAEAAARKKVVEIRLGVSVGTPKTLHEAIRTGVLGTRFVGATTDEIAVAIRTHVLDFLAQKFTAEMIAADRDTARLERLWDSVRGAGDTKGTGE